MSCEEIGYPYLETATGNHKHAGATGQGARCTTVIVKSNLVEVPIETIPTEDDKGRGTPGYTEFCREYPESAPLTVTLTAPSVFNDVEFQRWVVNGVNQSDGQTVVSFEVDSECIIAFAKYGIDIDPVNCSGITMPSHMLVRLTSSCEVINNVPDTCVTGVECLPRTWQAQGLSLTVVYDDGNWFGEKIIRDCPSGAQDPTLVTCLGADCTVRAPSCFGVPVPGCEPHNTGTRRQWVTKMAASFGIACNCNPATNTVTVNYGIGFSKEGCSAVMFYSVGGQMCGGGPAMWHCHVHGGITFFPAYDIPELLTATYDGTQQDCDAKAQQLAGGPFTTAFNMTVTTGAPPPPPYIREMRCTGTITAS